MVYSSSRSYVYLFLLKPNARFQARPEAAARHERRLEGVACKPLLNEALRAVRAACPYGDPGILLFG